MEELVGKWKSFPESQHIPLCAHLLGLSMKTVTQLALGERFKDDADVISFRKNHDAVREKERGCFKRSCRLYFTWRKRAKSGSF